MGGVESFKFPLKSLGKTCCKLNVVDVSQNMGEVMCNDAYDGDDADDVCLI